MRWFILGISLILFGCSTAEVEKEEPVTVMAPKGVSLPIEFFWGANMTDEFQQAVSRAMLTWEEAADRELFVNVGDDYKSGDDFDDHFGSLDDDVVGVYLRHRWLDKEKVLASTVYIEQEGRLTKMDLVFNMSKPFGDAEKDPNVFDVESVALHELGHMLGLGHTTSCTSAMSESRDTGAIVRSLSQQDKEALEKIYE